MRLPLLALLLPITTFLSAQTYFYIDEIQVQPPQPTTSDDISIALVGGLSSTGAYIVGASASVSGNTVTISIAAADPGGLTVIVPHIETVNVGYLPAGDYTIDFNAQNVGDFAPVPQHTFTVSGGGGSACDSLQIVSLLWNAFSDTALTLHVVNNSSEIFSYPNFILFDANGDTLAKETVNFFGIGGESWHDLLIQPGVTLPTGPFEGRLELWMLFTDTLACTWTGTYDLCPPAPCMQLVPTIQNIGGGIAIGTYGWTIAVLDGQQVASGTFTMTDSMQFDTAHVCLPPGDYAMGVSPNGPPTGGQPVFSVTAGGWISSPTIPVAWSLPVELYFSFYGPCVEDPQSVPELSAGTVIVQQHAGSLQVRRTDGGALGPIQLFDAQGRLLARSSTNSPELLLPLPSEAHGLCILRTEHGPVKVVLGR